MCVCVRPRGDSTPPLGVVLVALVHESSKDVSKLAGGDRLVAFQFVLAICKDIRAGEVAGVEEHEVVHQLQKSRAARVLEVAIVVRQALQPQGEDRSV